MSPNPLGVLLVVIETVRGSGKERCPKCGKGLKRTPHSYYCMRCKRNWSIKDIEVEVVE